MELKEAIEKAKKLVEDNYMADSENEAVATILKALEELQKENEGLKKLADHYQNLINYKYIQKDKIKEKIESLEEQEKAVLSEFKERNRIVLPTDTAYLFVSAEYYHKKEVLNELLKGE